MEGNVGTKWITCSNKPIGNEEIRVDKGKQGMRTVMTKAKWNTRKKLTASGKEVKRIVAQEVSEEDRTPEGWIGSSIVVNKRFCSVEEHGERPYSNTQSAEIGDVDYFR